MKSQLRTKSHENRCRISRSSDVGVFMDQAAIICIWPEGRGRAERVRAQSCGRADANSSIRSVHAAHAEFIAKLADHPPRPIPIYADAIDLEDRSDHLSRVLNAVSTYVTAMVDDAAQNAPSNVELCNIEAILSDLASDLTGAIQRAADDMAGRPA
jgi:hypothetical protein